MLNLDTVCTDLQMIQGVYFDQKTSNFELSYLLSKESIIPNEQLIEIGKIVRLCVTFLATLHHIWNHYGILPVSSSLTLHLSSHLGIQFSSISKCLFIQPTHRCHSCLGLLSSFHMYVMTCVAAPSCCTYILLYSKFGKGFLIAPCNFLLLFVQLASFVYASFFFFVLFFKLTILKDACLSASLAHFETYISASLHNKARNKWEQRANLPLVVGEMFLIFLQSYTHSYGPGAILLLNYTKLLLVLKYLFRGLSNKLVCLPF